MANISLVDLDDKAYFRDTDGSLLSIQYDSYADNPFAFYDSLGTFLTWENAHISPSENPYPTALDFLESALGEEKSRACDTMQDVLQGLDEAGYAVRGIYRFEHGNVSYALGESNPYGDPWDSGSVGFAFVSPEKLQAEGMTKDQAIACMEGEMREYSAWANGDVYLVERYDDKGISMEADTFYGMDSFEAEFPSIELLDLGSFPDLEAYSEHATLTKELENDWSFRPSASWCHDAYIKEPMAIVSDEMGSSWRIVNIKTAQVSYDTYDSPQEALSLVKQHEGMAKDELQSFIPPKGLMEKPLDYLMQEAKERADEKNAGRQEQSSERKSPDMER